MLTQAKNMRMNQQKMIWGMAMEQEDNDCKKKYESSIDMVVTS